MGEFAAKVGIGNRLEPFVQEPSLGEGGNPVFPVFAPHHLHGGSGFLFAGTFKGHLVHLAGVEIECVGGERLAEGLDGGPMHLARARMGSHGRRQAVYDEVNGAEFVPQRLCRALAHLVGKCIAIEGSGQKPRLPGSRLKGEVVIPASGSCPLRRRLLLKRDAERVGSCAKRHCDAGSKAETAGAAEDESIARHLGRGDGTPLPHELDLFLDASNAAGGVGGGADEAANAGLDYQSAARSSGRAIIP